VTQSRQTMAWRLVAAIALVVVIYAYIWCDQ
jgi:hypothetical protein